MKEMKTYRNLLLSGRLCETDALTADEKYFLFCEHLRAQLMVPGGHAGGKRSCGDALSSAYDRRPFAANSRRLSQEPSTMDAYWQSLSAPSSCSADASTANTEPDREEEEAETGQYPACFYTRMARKAPVSTDFDAPHTSRRHASGVFLDEDKLAQRLADQLRQSTRRKEVHRRAVERVASSGPLYNGAAIAPYADARIEAQLAELHDESTNLLIHVRHENRLSCELRERLVHSKLLMKRTETLQQRDAIA